MGIYDLNMKILIIILIYSSFIIIFLIFRFKSICIFLHLNHSTYESSTLQSWSCIQTII